MQDDQLNKIIIIELLCEYTRLHGWHVHGIIQSVAVELHGLIQRYIDVL